MQPEVIRNCWRHNGMEGEEQINLEREIVNPGENDEGNLQTVLERWVGQDARMSLYTILKMPGEELHTHILSDDYLLDFMVDEYGSESSEEEPEGAVSEQTSTQCLSAVSVLKRLTDSRDALRDALGTSLKRCIAIFEKSPPKISVRCHCLTSLDLPPRPSERTPLKPNLEPLVRLQ